MSEMGSIWRYLLGVAVGSAWVLTANCVKAQITPDRTLPNNSSVTINGSTFNITGGTQAGRNLFHSFQQFSVPTGGTASFNNGSDIQNVLSRVTGSSVSNIDGTIKANGTANVFFINPNGIVFGKNASLNIGGSFVATTANAIQFGNFGTFSATTPDAPSPLLTINPSALVFNQVSIGAITNRSVAPAGISPTGDNVQGLRVPDGQSLLVLGGSVSLDGGSINAYGGRVELGGLAAPGSVVLGNNLSLSFPDHVARASVSLSNKASVKVEAAGGGNIAVNASNLDVTGGSTLSAGIGQGLGSVNSLSGDVKIDAMGEIKVSGIGSSITNNVQSKAVGNGGHINITTGSLAVDGATIQTRTFGQGNAGSLTIVAPNQVSFTNGAFALTTAEPGSVGTGGNLWIQAGSVSVTNDSQLKASTLGQGNSGNLTIDARDTVEFVNKAFAFTQVQGGIGNGGEMKISTGSLSVTNGSFLSASTLGKGNAGSLRINARDSVSFTNGGGAFTTVEPGAIGNGNDLRIQAKSVLVSSGSFLTANTLGYGNAGNVIIDARDFVQFKNGSATSRVLSPVVGNAGDISITTGSLSLSNSALLSTSNIAGQQGNGGKVTINAQDRISLDGAAIFSGIESQQTLGNSGDISINTGFLSVINAAQLYTSNRGQKGNAGNITINARDSIFLNNGGAIFSRVEGQGNAGNVTLNAQNNISFNGSAVFSSLESPGLGNSGDIGINAGSVSLINGAQLYASNRGQKGNAGNVTINARDSISFNGASIFSNLEPQAASNNSNTSATTGSLSVRDSVQMNDNNQVQGSAGDIQIRSRSLKLDNQAGILAKTTSGNGGNITLRTQNFLVLRRNSQISTTAGTTGAGGNGGNITISTPFIIAFPNENSDITANAFRGQGGKIDINTQENFFIAPVSRQELESRIRQINPNLPLDPVFLPTNDITAISQTNPNLSGQVTVISPEIDPTRDLILLPSVTENTPKLVSSACAVFNEYAGGSSFTITGRGGLPPSPDESLISDALWTDTRLSVATAQQQHHKTRAAKSKPQLIAIIPATGWVFNDKGEVTLISTATNATTVSTPTSCPAQ
jgi:filamentous hemagglutinin family protein